MFEISRGAQILLFIASIVVLAEGFYLYKLQTAPPLNSCRYLIAEWEKTNPEDAASREAYAGPIADINFDNTIFTQARQFETVIRNAVAQGPNFAGHFTIAEIGCGSNCQNHAIVDVITGNIVAFGLPSEAGLKYSISSPLIMTNPAPNAPIFRDIASEAFEEKLYWFNVPREYYALTEKDSRVFVRRLCIENSFDGQL